METSSSNGGLSTCKSTRKSPVLGALAAQHQNSMETSSSNGGLSTSKSTRKSPVLGALVAQHQNSMETSSSNGGLSTSKSTRKSPVLGALAGGVSAKTNRGGIDDVADSLVPSNPPSDSVPAEAKGNIRQKTALAQFFSKNQARAGENSRMLVTVNIIGSTGPLRFLVDFKDPVSRVMELALRAYAREGRLPDLGGNCRCFEVFCANSDFQALDPVQSVGNFGTRQFLMHRKRYDQEPIGEQIEEVASLPWKFW